MYFYGSNPEHPGVGPFGPSDLHLNKLDKDEHENTILKNTF